MQKKRLEAKNEIRHKNDKDLNIFACDIAKKKLRVSKIILNLPLKQKISPTPI